MGSEVDALVERRDGHQGGRLGGGKRARLVLRRAAEAWRYEIVNDPGTGSVAADGAGLAGIERRVREFLDEAPPASEGRGLDQPPPAVV